MTTIERLNLMYVRATDAGQKAALLAAIDDLMAEPNCPRCGIPMEAGTCWNLFCDDGERNINSEIGDRAYHAAADRRAEAGR